MNNSILTATSNLSLGRNLHERSQSDTHSPLPSVSLSAESSSVTSLSNKLKHISTGMYTFWHSSVSHVCTENKSWYIGQTTVYFI